MTQIDAKSKSIREILDREKYSIDYYQREYKWGQKHITELIDDLENKFLESYKPNHDRQQVSEYMPYFLGPIVISRKKDGKYFIIDGQQRLTSLTLLFIFLHNLQKDSDESVDVRNLIFSDKYGKKSFNINVDDRDKCFNALYSELPYEPVKPTETEINIVDRYHDIVSIFPESLKNSVLPYFIDWLMEKVFMVQITTNSDDEAYTIFETMNDRGLSLSQSEMLKGYLLSQIVNSKDKECANQTWKNQVVLLSHLNNDEVGDFIKSWLRSKYAITIRSRKKGATAKDFEKIGTEFNKWVRDNKDNIGLNKSRAYYNIITKDFVLYSDYYLFIRKACNEFNPELECIYYNAHNNYSLQYPTLLAPITKRDDNDTAITKMKIISRYLDIMIARRYANFRLLTYSSQYFAIFSLIKEIRNKNSEALVDILYKKLDAMDENLDGITILYLHQQNRRHIHYLLARIIYHIESQSGVDTDFVKYVTKNVKRPFEIEHLWANKYERHTKEFNTSQDFAQYRNSLGGLILIPRGFNQSLSDDTYEEKVKHYIKENLLAQSLSKKCYQKNPSFIKYINSHNLNFKPYLHFRLAHLKERKELYLQISSEIWNPNRLYEELDK